MSIVFFIIAPNWKQPKCLSSPEWINKLKYKQTMEYFSVIQRKKTLRHATKYKNFKNFVLSERSQI